MTRKRDIRKSEFNVVTSNESSDYFDFIRNGQNLRIAHSNMSAGFGTTGSVSPTGEATAIPVLQIVGTVNYIRGILAGSGINAQISAQNGVEISHNLTAGSSGSPVMTNVAGTSPIIRSLVAGAGITLTDGIDSIEVAVTSAPVSTKTVPVYDIGDFPAPVGSLITLLGDTEYQLQDDISSSYIFSMGSGTILSATDKKLITLETTNVGNLITATDSSCKIKDIKLVADSGTLFNITSSTGNHTLEIENVDSSCDNIGSFQSLALLSIKNCNFNPIYVSGISFSGSLGVSNISDSDFVIPSGTGNAIDLGTATFDFFLLEKTTFDVDSTGYGITGLVSSGNINSGGFGVFFLNRNVGSADFSNNIYPTDDRWYALWNLAMADTHASALAYNSALTVTISAAVTPAVIGPSWTSLKSDKFTFSAAGQWTYLGRPDNVEITLKINAEITSGTDNCTFFIYKNGVLESGSSIVRELTSGAPETVILLWDVDLETGDYLQFYVQNNDTDENVYIDDIFLRIRS